METLPAKKDHLAEKYKHIKGWGVDIDPENDPTYPMKHITGDDHLRLNYERPALQQSDVEILHSNERPNLTAVYGTSTPPSGLSGRIRRYAFKHSEGKFAHWIPLIIADRVNALEGIFQDLGRGKIPNIFAERGWKAEWKYNRASMTKKIAVTALIATAAILWLGRKRRKIS